MLSLRDLLNLQSIPQPLKVKYPLIVSASRATDIPAFYANWFFTALKQGQVLRINPFNPHQRFVVDFSQTKLIVFWSKYPKPLIPYLSQIDKMGYAYYFLFTLNNYEEEGFEPRLPSLSERVSIFKNLSSILSSKRVIWRFDPLIITPTLFPRKLYQRISDLANELAPYTDRLIVSFLDLYPKVKRRLTRLGFEISDWTTPLVEEMAYYLSLIKQEFGITITTCAESYDLSKYGIEKKGCIDPETIYGLLEDLPSLKKDKNQRKKCLCVESQDIGMYNTCHFKCTYCYAY